MKTKITTVSKIGITLALLATSILIYGQGQYDSYNDQGILIKNEKLIYFNLSDYFYRQMRLNPKEWERNLVRVGKEQYVKKGYLQISFIDFKRIIEVRDAKYMHQFMWGDRIKPYDKHEFKVYYRLIDETRTEVSKDNETWEPLIVEFRSYENLWPAANFITYLHNDYKCTLYFKCSFFEGLYDVFTLPEEPG